MRVGILGPLEVELDGRSLAVGGARLRALVARLALGAGRPVSAAGLVEAVWDGGVPADEGHALQSLVSRLRGLLGDPELVAAVPGGGYRLAVAAEAVDAERFERLAGEGAAALRAGDHARAVEVLGAALALWRGPVLGDLPAHRFVVAAAAALDERRLTAIADRVEAELALGGGVGLVGELEALVAEHPLHERLAGQLIAALYRAGRQADALAAYERVRARLADELGVVPSPALQEAHMAVLRGDPAPRLDTPPPTQAPPPRAPRRSNLTAAMTSFVGREREIARIDRLLGESRLITLVGPGGAGKTRLAREAAGGWVDRVADGVWMVELAPITEAVEIVPALVGALGLRETASLDTSATRAPRDALERLLDLLHEREAIVVLDNCEHLVADVAALVERLLGECPRLRILATSREPLAITGESLAPVPALGLPAPDATPEVAIVHPAVRLFADRAAAVHPGFAVDATTVAAVVEICRRLDGLPLAIELAAARLRSMDVQQIAARLDDRFRLLTGGSRTALPRHRTLRAVVDWSWELLTEPERRLARRLAVFGAGATVESAAAACADPDTAAADVLDGLAALVDRSLLQVVPGTDPVRYRMLETIREYGLQRLAEAGEIATVRTAHARFFAALTATAEPHLRAATQIAWFRRMEAERENVLAALRWMGDTGDAAGAVRLAVDLLWFWMLTGSSEEASSWIVFALDVPGTAEPDDRLIAEGVRMIVEAAERNGDMLGQDVRGELGELYERLLALDDRERPLVAVAKPILAMFSGDEEEAERQVGVALAHPDPWVHAATLLARGAHAENAGRAEAMAGYLADALTAYEAIGDRWGTSLVLTLESSRRTMLGDLDGAEAACARGLRLMEELAATSASWVLELRAAELLARRGDLAGARERATLLRDRSDISSDDRFFALAAIARIALAQGDPDAARRELVDITRRLDAGEVPHSHARAVVEATIAATDLAAGDAVTARRRLVSAYATAVRTSDMPILAAVGAVVAAATLERGEPAGAAEILGAADVLRGGPDPANPELIALKAELRAALGEPALDAAYAAGRALAPPDAIARLDPAGSRAAAVGP